MHSIRFNTHTNTHSNTNTIEHFKQNHTHQSATPCPFIKFLKLCIHSSKAFCLCYQHLDKYPWHSPSRNTIYRHGGASQQRIRLCVCLILKRYKFKRNTNHLSFSHPPPIKSNSPVSWIWPSQWTLQPDKNSEFHKLFPVSFLGFDIWSTCWSSRSRSVGGPCQSTTPKLENLKIFRGTRLLCIPSFPYAALMAKAAELWIFLVHKFLFFY